MQAQLRLDIVGKLPPEEGLHDKEKACKDEC